LKRAQQFNATGGAPIAVAPVPHRPDLIACPDDLAEQNMHPDARILWRPLQPTVATKTHRSAHVDPLGGPCRD
jgi:hypothetical protein